MGGVCSARRNGERSPRDAGEGGAPPSYFDVAWDESDGYAPISSVGGGSGGDALSGGGIVAAGAHGRRRVGRVEASSRGEEAGRITGGRRGSSQKWPILAKKHLSLLYSNEEWCRPSVDGPGWEPVSLTELCVRSICRRLSELGSFPSQLPREVVDALLDSLTQHRALSSYTLGAFRNCEVTRLSLGGCRGVRNGWVRRLLGDTPCGRSITWLDLSTCTGLTDTGLSQLPALRNLEAASLRHCVGLGAEATLCLSNSPCLETLSLAHCPLLDDAAMENLAGLSKLRSLEIEGCENITDRGLRVASGLPSLTCLNASRCRGITVEGLTGLSRAAHRLRRLNLGWCPGLAANRNRSGGVEGRGVGGVGGGVGRGGVENDDDDDDDEDEEDDEEELDVDGDGGRQGWEDGQQQQQVNMEGEEEKRDDGGRGRGREWALPPLPRLENLCLARSGIGDSGLSRLAAESPDLATLELSNCLSITSSGAERLSALKKLERVDLSRCRMVASVSAGMSKSVRTLNLAETAVRDEEVQTISRELTGLTALNLDRCDVGDASLRALSKMTQLERLNLADTGVTDAGMARLAPLTRLKDLNLFFCAISDSGLTSLTTLTGLKRLNLDTRDVGDAGMVQLTPLRLLETLDVFSSSVTDFGVAHGLSRLPSLTSLEICSGRLTDRGLLHLSRVKTLTRLNVSQNQGITPAGLRHVGTMTRLRELNLSSCSITPASLDSLAGLVKLESLAVFGCRLGISDLERLRGKMPNLKVVRAA